jgi:hypothetical protein
VDEITVLCIRWHTSSSFRLRDLTEMIDERRIYIRPSTIWRWVQRRVPEFKKRRDRSRRRTGGSGRVDQTHVQIRSRWLRPLPKQHRPAGLPDGQTAMLSDARLQVCGGRDHGCCWH